MLSRTSLDRLLNRIDSSSVSKDGKTEAVMHGLLEQQQTLCTIFHNFWSEVGKQEKSRFLQRAAMLALQALY